MYPQERDGRKRSAPPAANDDVTEKYENRKSTSKRAKTEAATRNNRTNRSQSRGKQNLRLVQRSNGRRLNKRNGTGPTRTSTKTKTIAPSNSSASRHSSSSREEELHPQYSGHRFGRRGDPRMAKALKMKLENPDTDYTVALSAGGYKYKAGANDKSVDSDGITLGQRRNQLARRLRMEKRKERGADGDEDDNPRRTRKSRRKTRASRALSHSPSPLISLDVAGKVTKSLPVGLGSPDVSDLSDIEQDDPAIAESVRYCEAAKLRDAAAASSSAAVEKTAKSTTFASGTKAGAPDKLAAMAMRIKGPRPSDARSLDDSGETRDSMYLFDDPDIAFPSLGDPLLPSLPPTPARSRQSSSAGVAPSLVQSATPDTPIAEKDVDGDDDDTNSVIGENLTEEDIFGLTPQERAEAHADVRGLRRLDSTLVQGLMSKFLGTQQQVNSMNENNSRTGVVVDASAMTAGKSFQSLVTPPVHTLVRQMKVEIEARPFEERHDMLHAFVRCSNENRKIEFGEGRLELFLRRENMDPALAAKRFCRYWTKRKELFGPLYYLPLSIDGALRNDRVSLMLGHWIILPEPDDHGRTIMLWLKQGPYDFQSMSRAMFYIAEQATELPSSRNGVVWLSWDKNTTIWKYDRRLDEIVTHLEEHYLPLEVTAIHICSVQGYLWKLLKPIVLACFGRRTRARLRIHLASDGDIADVLTQFGIRRNALPTFMGGEVDVVGLYRKWLRDRGI